MRLFIGISLPKKLRERVYDAARSIREASYPIRWVDEKNLHVTLKFLGEVKAERVAAVEESMSRVAEKNAPFVTTLEGFGAFPTVRRPRVLWIGVGPTSELRCLKQDLELAMGALGFEVETRAFHPHVTVGRADPRGGAGAFRGLDELVASSSCGAEVKVHTVDLIRSRLSAEGATYSVVSGMRLAA